MNSSTTIPITEARRKLFQLVRDVQTPGLFYTLTEKGRPKVVLMSAEEFESWRETLEAVTEFPDLKKDMEQVEKDIKSGDYKKYPTLEEVMMEHGYMLADKGKRKYHVADKIRKKSQKRPR
ncbi:type II toxin-antitoxin system Phd/YefM family antitoxin [Candidatus Roizmanbacteria bacterium]|nr:type II toxin-antitoxin system Phd/YefM family antitoxin [Candidatus Roizmanbacteria bacterium]